MAIHTINEFPSIGETLTLKAQLGDAVILPWTPDMKPITYTGRPVNTMDDKSLQVFNVRSYHNEIVLPNGSYLNVEINGSLEQEESLYDIVKFDGHGEYLTVQGVRKIENRANEEDKFDRKPFDESIYMKEYLENKAIQEAEELRLNRIKTEELIAKYKEEGESTK